MLYNRINKAIYVFLMVIAFAFCPLSIVKADTIYLWPLSETTPNHVFSIWVNINKMLSDETQLNNNSVENIADIEASPQSELKNITPRDVLGKINKLRIMLDSARRTIGLFDTSISRTSSQDQMKPSNVFMNSLLVMASIQEWQEKTISGDRDYAPYYVFDVPSDKKPSDVYAQVDLAISKLETIVASSSN